MLNNNSEKEIPIISICIPTFNRCDKVYKLVNDILLYPGKEIEVIVLDNCSTDETKKILSKIIDNRFSFIQNEENIGGVLNLLKSISMGSGKFSFLCLDKDYLDYRAINKLLYNINLDPEVVFGHCKLNTKEEGQDVIYDKGFDSVINMAFLSRHPTGMFYKTSEYKNLDLLKNIFIEKKQFPFYSDIINGEMAMRGKSRFINLPSFYSETKEEARQKPSFTYNKNNLYFSPQKRRIEFDTYLEYAGKLKLSNYEFYKLILRLYNQELTLSTFVYKYMMSDNDVCGHHNIALEKISIFEILKINLKFSSHFISRNIAVNILQKILIVIFCDIKFLIKLILYLFKRI